MASETGVRRRRRKWAERKVAKTAQIAKFISSNYFVGSNVDRQLNQALKRRVQAGKITQKNGRLQLKTARAATKSKNRKVGPKMRAVRYFCVIV